MPELYGVAENNLWQGSRIQVIIISFDRSKWKSFLYIKAVQYNQNNDFTTWKESLKRNATNISDEIKEVFNNIIPDMDDQIGWHDFFYDLDNGGIDDFISKHKIADENFRQFLNNIGNAKFNMADYQQWLSENSRATNTFASITRQTENILKSFGSSLGNIAINLIVDEIIGDLNKIANAEKETAEKTKELYNDSNMGTQRYKETINVLNDIIEKYINTINEQI